MFLFKVILSSIKICSILIRFATAFEKYSESQVLTAIYRVHVKYRDSLAILLRKCNSETEDHIDQILALGHLTGEHLTALGKLEGELDQ